MSVNTIILAGGSGFLGTYLANRYLAKGWSVVVLGRSEQPKILEGVRYIRWDARTLGRWATELEGADSIVNLCGRTVDCRYTAGNRRQILESRLDSTRVLRKAIQKSRKPPRKWINAASATIYADTRGDFAANTEDAGVIGSGFSVDVCREWEAAFLEDATLETERTLLRVSIVLGRDGGAFVPIHRLARFGIGGQQGSGDQFISWIHVDDFVGVVEAVIDGTLPASLYNCASPDSRTNAAFMRSLRSIIDMPIGLPLPAWALELGAYCIRTETELILKSRKVAPENLLKDGYRFCFPNLETALRDLTDSTVPHGAM